MAQPDIAPPESAPNTTTKFLRKIFGRRNGSPGAVEDPLEKKVFDPENDPKPGLIRRVSRKVVPGLPRTQTFKRQQSERRNNLAPVEPTPAERRAVSMDRRLQVTRTTSQSQSFPRASAPDILDDTYEDPKPVPLVPTISIEDDAVVNTNESENENDNDNESESITHDPARDDASVLDGPFLDTLSVADAQSLTASQLDDEEKALQYELETKWILNLSMHFRDRSKREKFFVTYRENESLWRRVTISLDYRNALENSLEMDLLLTNFQRDKSRKIYEAIRDSIGDIQFYDTVTNLKLQTTDGRLHVHVVEDVNVRFSDFHSPQASHS
jgi:hypothetical protein